ncbi:MAG: apolipoprotein N-acyltransferase, partial [Candidatus Latescibacterota bacterium]
GLVFSTGLLFWVAHTTIAGTVVLVCYLALYPAVFCVLSEYVGRRLHLPFPWVAALVWTSLEYVRTWGLFGFPWQNLGHILGAHPVLIQSAAYASVLGISFWMVLINGMIFEALRTAGRRRARWIVLIAVFLAAPYVHGRIVLGHAPKTTEHESGNGKRTPREEGSEKELRVALVQGNIDQSIKWDSRFLNHSLQTYDRLTRSLRTPLANPPDSLGMAIEEEKLDLIVWPETAAPVYLLKRSVHRDWVTGLARIMEAPILTGANDYERIDGDKVHIFNSAILFDPELGPVKKTDKRHLVAFSERVPLLDRFPALDRLCAKLGQGDLSPANFTPGAERVLFDLRGGPFSVLICFEAIFPDEVRRFVTDGAQFLVNITNDGWFGRYSAAHQHAQIVAFRAVENRIWIARCANTGISLFIDPWGRVPQSTPIYQESTLVCKVGPKGRETFYSKHGDVFAKLCLACTLVMIAWAGVFPKRNRKPETTHRPDAERAEKGHEQ